MLLQAQHCFLSKIYTFWGISEIVMEYYRFDRPQRWNLTCSANLHDGPFLYDFFFNAARVHFCGYSSDDKSILKPN